jgi:hypothetical protein
MKKIILASILAMSATPAFTQNNSLNYVSQESQKMQGKAYISVRDLSVPDCSGQTTMWPKFDTNKTKLLVIPDTPSDSAALYKLFHYLKASYKEIKKESELTENDFDNGLCVYGVIADFKHWEKFNTPFRKVGNIFEFEGKRYASNNDGFFFISGNRLVYSGNSMEQVWKMQSTYASNYRYMIFEDGLLSKLCISDTSIINTKLILKSNYDKISDNFFAIFIDKKLEKEKLNLNDSTIIDICRKMELPLPDFRINCFLHSDPNATRLFSNFYHATGCDTLPPDMVFGTVQLDGIHITGMDTEFIRHEAFHYLWRELVGRGTEFFNEGIQEYYQQLLDPSRIDRNINVLKSHRDYDITTLVLRGNSEDFWGGPSENDWPVAYNISGLFVKYLIDMKGLDIFKEFFVNSQSEESLTHYYNDNIIKDFNNWMGR